MSRTTTLAQRPPMGWNSWNCFRNSTVNGAALLEVAQAIVDSGMRDAGYEYVVLDDHWQARRRDSAGRLQADSSRFPDGIAALVDSVHALGLKFGIYSVPGSTTCGQYYDGYPAEGIGSLGYEALDAETFADWGIDFLKYDWCRAHLNDGLEASAAFARMCHELDETGRDILYSISEYGLFRPWEWAPAFANMWRTTDDLHADWGSLSSTISQQLPISGRSRPGGWNDPDMLQVGNGSLTDAEMRTHLSVWAITNAPLMSGNDLRSLTDSVADLLTNRTFLTIDQDWGGSAGTIYGHYHPFVDIWTKPMSTGGRSIALVNMHDDPCTVDLRPHLDTELQSGSYLEAWSGHEFTLDEFAHISLAPHDALLLMPKEVTTAPDSAPTTR